MFSKLLMRKKKGNKVSKKQWKENIRKKTITEIGLLDTAVRLYHFFAQRLFFFRCIVSCLPCDLKILLNA